MNISEPVETMVALGFAARDQAVERGTVQTTLTMFMTGPESAHAYRVAKTDPHSHLLVRYKRKEMVFNGQYQGSAPSLKGMSLVGAFGRLPWVVRFGLAS